MACTQWSIATELSTGGWSVDTESTSPSWSTLQETAGAAFAALSTECSLASDLGFILRTPDGTALYRLGVDDDGTVMSTGLGYTHDTDELILTTAGTGIIVKLDDDTYGRMRVDNDGVLVAEPVTIDGWIVDKESIGSEELDILVAGDGTGALCTTPDGTHVYRVRLDIDGAFISEMVS